MTLPPALHRTIVDALSERPDIWRDGDVVVANGAPAIRGTRLMRFKETAVIGPDTYHPYTRIQWIYVGQSFAIETDIAKGAKPFTKKQLEWRADFEAAGGVYIAAWSMADVYEVLGKTRPEPFGEYETRQTKVR